MTFCLTLPVWGHRLGRSRLQQAQAGMQTGAFWPADTRSGASLCSLASPLPCFLLQARIWSAGQWQYMPLTQHWRQRQVDSARFIL